MGIESHIERISENLGDSILGLDRKSDRRVYLDIAPTAIGEASRLMFEDLGARFQIATGVDTPGGIEVLYHWALDGDDCLVTIRVLLEHAHPAVDSIAGICPAAEWIEREMWELLGIDFRNHPDLRHLLLDDNWPAGDYPLRRNRGVKP